MINLPERINLANLPTRIEKLGSVSGSKGDPVVYIKRDDETGMETSGNKIRKLEYSIKEALDERCNCLITCGGIQSNHCRATVAAGAKLGMKVCIVLQGDPVSEYDGNLFLDKLLGADIRFVSPAEYKQNKTEIMEHIKKEMESQGLRPYIIPSGASNGIGALRLLHGASGDYRNKKTKWVFVSIALLLRWVQVGHIRGCFSEGLFWLKPEAFTGLASAIVPRNAEQQSRRSSMKARVI